MIIDKKPKFYWLLKIFFPDANWEAGLIITYRPWIFCKNRLSDSLIAHESTHLRQQVHPIFWWIKYICSPLFRLSQEVDAHRNEYKAVVGSKNARYRALQVIATRLSSKLYKNLVTLEEAITLITKP